METNDSIKKIKDNINMYKNEKKKYYLENSKYIFQYFEDKQNISNLTITNSKITNKNVLNTFFKIKSDNNTSINIDNYVNSKQILQNYWKNINNEVINFIDFIVPNDKCFICNNGELIISDEEGLLICNNVKCCNFISNIIDNSKPLNKEPPNEASYTAYVRLNHFKEILSQFQAKETTQIPNFVIENIRKRIKKERITDLSLIDYDKMKEILRKLGYNKYFEHIQYINSVFGIAPPIMNETFIDTLCVLFIEIQKPWAIHCPKDRTNFFNYTYILYQLCALTEQTQYLPYISKLKNVLIQREQDASWKNVCKELGWLFIPSV
jgi:hypothetical protein